MTPAGRTLSDFTVPIGSGLIPKRREFRLSPERAAELRRGLDAMARARAEAALASRFYLVRAGGVCP
jgi:hypothetical protein